MAPDFPMLMLSVAFKLVSNNVTEPFSIQLQVNATLGLSYFAKDNLTPDQNQIKVLST